VKEGLKKKRRRRRHVYVWYYYFCFALILTGEMVTTDHHHSICRRTKSSYRRHLHPIHPSIHPSAPCVGSLLAFLMLLVAVASNQNK